MKYRIVITSLIPIFLLGLIGLTSYFSNYALIDKNIECTIIRNLSDCDYFCVAAYQNYSDTTSCSNLPFGVSKHDHVLVLYREFVSSILGMFAILSIPTMLVTIPLIYMIIKSFILEDKDDFIRVSVMNPAHPNNKQNGNFFLYAHNM
jgi:hypothetical protein